MICVKRVLLSPVIQDILHDLLWHTLILRLFAISRCDILDNRSIHEGEESTWVSVLTADNREDELLTEYILDHVKSLRYYIAMIDAV